MATSKSSSPAKAEKIKNFDPNGPANGGRLFGLPFDPEESEIVIVPVPWDATASYGKGTSKGPQAILAASAQVDLYQADFPEIWKEGFAMLPVSDEIKKRNKALRKTTDKILELQHSGATAKEIAPLLVLANKECVLLNQWVEQQTASWIKKGKMVGVLGGEHSVPYGFIKALSREYSSFGILQIDAHADLRKAYEGIKFSHASIMFNLLGISQIKKLVQIGIRDICAEEIQCIGDSAGRIKTCFSSELAEARISGKGISAVIEKYIDELPEYVYLSFDIDGMDPKLCPNTGTPVPGGLEFEEAAWIIRKLRLSGRKIIGFDLNEVAPGKDEWDANVGARMLFYMGVQALLSKRNVPAKKQAASAKKSARKK
jgi:agmatinase